MENYNIIISNYSSYDTPRYNIEDNGSRVASVFDKIIEIASRKCDSYSSDAFWDMKSFYDAIEKSEMFDKVLLFRETGVRSISVPILNTLGLSTARELTKEQCAWRLQHIQKLDEETNKIIWVNKLTRVYFKLQMED